MWPATISDTNDDRGDCGDDVERDDEDDDDADDPEPDDDEETVDALLFEPTDSEDVVAPESLDPDRSGFACGSVDGFDRCLCDFPCWAWGCCW